MVGILDYGIGNLVSVTNMIDYVGGGYEFIKLPSEILRYDKIILSGVGHFGKAMRILQNDGWIETLNKAKSNRVEIMGICLGMQLMTSYSQEGEIAGLGWFSSKTIKFPNIDKEGNKLLIPHMGWNKVTSKDETIVKSDSRFYFVHSYFVDAVGTEDSLLESEYGGVIFSSGIKKSNLLGFQFHPEKSHKYGMELFKYFIDK